jgi:hypothetical protein
VLGLINNVVVFERETYEVFMNENKDAYNLEKAVRLNIKDYKIEDKHVDLVKISTHDGQTILIISETLSYQTQVPF